jgi:hypothetical protein
MNNISIIIFTCKRALQLDLLLRSIFKNFKDLNTPIFLVYDYNKSHSVSYDLIKKKWNKKIKIFKVNTKKTFPFSETKKYRKYFFRIINYMHNIRWKFFGFSDLKIVLENILSNKIKTEYVTMMTDDTVLFKKNKINNLVLKKINESPKKFFYRYCIDKNFKGLENPKKAYNLQKLNEKNSKLFKWRLKNNYFSFHNYFWNYRFSIDACIFDRKQLIKFLTPIFYSNPSNLESIGNKETYLREFYEYGISDLNRTYAGLHLNNIQTMVDTPAGNFDVDFLQILFLNGYKISINPKQFNKKVHNIVPKDIIFLKNNKKYKYSNLINDLQKGKKI